MGWGHPSQRSAALPPSLWELCFPAISDARRRYCCVLPSMLIQEGRFRRGSLRIYEPRAARVDSERFQRQDEDGSAPSRAAFAPPPVTGVLSGGYPNAMPIGHHHLVQSRGAGHT